MTLTNLQFWNDCVEEGVCDVPHASEDESLQLVVVRLDELLEGCLGEVVGRIKVQRPDLALYNTIQHTQYNTTQYNTIQHNTTQQNTIQYNTTQS